ncbi:MAG: hypothetical protein KIS78_11600 [Labilithrix sp.]|nr:hypothetical protein [Labilithrix sp.]MCW5833042.1 hypothetical protein [Labilithrix sp.]
MTEAEVRWLAEYAEDGEVCFRVGARGAEVVAEWSGLATLAARRDGTDVRLRFEPGVDPRDVRKIERGSAWLLVRHLQGRVGLHGAAVSVGDRAVVLLGRSGEGKSTLAAATCLRGAELLADDAVGLDEAGTAAWRVVPSEVDHWLDGEAQRALGVGPAAEAKAPTRAAAPAESARSLVAFVELAFVQGPPRLTRLAGLGAAAVLVPQVARFVLDEPERQRRELDLLHAIVDAVPVFRLERRRSFDDLGPSVDLVLDVLGRNVQTGV